MYHSILLGSMEKDSWINTFEDWHLIPSSRPVIKMPSVKTNYIEVPGADGTIDFTERVRGYPLYNNREGSLEFYVLNGFEEWYNLCDLISNKVHGKILDCRLEDQPDWFYHGRFFFNEWRSEKDYSKIVLDYHLDPYKYTTELYKQELFKGTSDTSNYTFHLNNLLHPIGLMPVAPTITISDIPFGKTMNIKFTNKELGIELTKKYPEGSYNDFLCTNLSQNNDNNRYLNMTGPGTVTISYRNGRL